MSTMQPFELEITNHNSTAEVESSTESNITDFSKTPTSAGDIATVSRNEDIGNSEEVDS